MSSYWKSSRKDENVGQTNQDQLNWLGGVAEAGNLTSIAAVQIGSLSGTVEMSAQDALAALKEMSAEDLARPVYADAQANGDASESTPEAGGAAESDTPQPSAEAEVSPSDERESVTITPADVGTIDAADLVGEPEKPEEG